MAERASHDGPDPARERIAEVLRNAWTTPEDPLLEDETRRLMLHLAVQPYEEEPAQPRSPPPAPPPRRSLLRRMLGRR